MISQLSQYADMRLSQRLPEKYWLKRRDQRLRQLLAHAYETVPYYRELFDAAGVSPRDVRSSDDLQSLPVTRKKDLQALPLQFRISSKYSLSELRHIRTTGSTGYPFDIYHDTAFQRIRMFMFIRALSGGIYRFPMKLLGTANEKKRADRLYRLIRWQYISNTAEVEEILASLKLFKPDVFYAAVSAIRPLAEQLGDINCRDLRVGAVYTTAESLDQRTRSLLTQYLADEVFEIYGTSESGALAWECTSHSGLHLAEDRVVFEFTDSAVPGSRNLVVTSVDSYGMPLIRYEVGDLVGEPITARCDCGCRFRRIKSVEGRLFDAVTLANGRALSPIHLTGAMEELTWVRRYQVIQESMGKFRVKIQLFDQHKNPDLRAIEHRLRPLLGNEARVVPEIVDTIEPKAGSKFRTVLNMMRHECADNVKS